MGLRDERSNDFRGLTGNFVKCGTKICALLGQGPHLWRWWLQAYRLSTELIHGAGLQQLRQRPTYSYSNSTPLTYAIVDP